MIREKPARVILISFVIIFLILVSDSKIPKMGTVLFYPICRELQKEIIVSDKRDYNKFEGLNYNIYYKNQSYSYIEQISSSIEKNLEYITKEFKFIPKDKVDIIIYHDYDEMAKKTKLGNGVAAVGAYYSGTISILNSNEIKNYVIDNDSVILHELTHYILDYMCGGNIPVWFTEGVALYEEYKIYNHHWPVRKINNFYDHKQLQNYFYEIDEISAYSQSFLIINYIVNNFGMESINNIIVQLSFGKSIEQAVEIVLKLKIEDMFSMYKYIDK